jgi:WD40 repeat protein
MLASAAGNDGIRLWKYPDPAFPDLQGQNPTQPVRFSPDGRYFVTHQAPETAALRTSDTGMELGRISEVSHILGFTPSGEFLAQGGGPAVQVLSVPELIPLRRFELEMPLGVVPAMGAEISPDARQLARPCVGGRLLVWNLQTGSLKANFLPHDSGFGVLAFSSDGRRLLTGGVDEKVRLWNTENFRCLREFSQVASPVWKVAFTPDDSGVLSGHLNGEYTLFDADTGRPISHLRATGNGIATFLGGGETLAFTDADRIQFWRLDSGRLAGSVPMGGLGGHFFTRSPDGSSLATITANHRLIWLRAPMSGFDEPTPAGTIVRR